MEVLLAICPRTDVTSGCQVPMITPAVLGVDRLVQKLSLHERAKPKKLYRS